MHRRHDARRVSQVHRARRGAGAALPAGAGRRAAASRRRFEILHGVRARYEEHHQLKITDEALKAAAEHGRPLHHRPLHARQGDRPDRRGRVTRAHAALGRAAEPEGGACAGLEALQRELDAADQRAGVRAGRRAARPRAEAARADRQLRSRSWQTTQGRRTSSYVTEEDIAAGRVDVDRHPGRCASPAKSPSGCSRWRTALHERVIGQEEAIDDDRQGRAPRACRAEGSRSARLARSSSSARPASARPSWPRRWPSSCSARKSI